jgi:hypothetical protein
MWMVLTDEQRRCNAEIRLYDLPQALSSEDAECEYSVTGLANRVPLLTIQMPRSDSSCQWERLYNSKQ